MTNEPDLVTRLRASIEYEDGDADAPRCGWPDVMGAEETMEEAADEIERLRKIEAAARSAVRTFELMALWEPDEIEAGKIMNADSGAAAMLGHQATMRGLMNAVRSLAASLKPEPDE